MVSNNEHEELVEYSECILLVENLNEKKKRCLIKIEEKLSVSLILDLFGILTIFMRPTAILAEELSTLPTFSQFEAGISKYPMSNKLKFQTKVFFSWYFFAQREGGQQLVKLNSINVQLPPVLGSLPKKEVYSTLLQAGVSSGGAIFLTSLLFESLRTGKIQKYIVINLRGGSNLLIRTGKTLSNLSSKKAKSLFSMIVKKIPTIKEYVTTLKVIGEELQVFSKSIFVFVFEYNQGFLYSAILSYTIRDILVTEFKENSLRSFYSQSCSLAIASFLLVQLTSWGSFTKLLNKVLIECVSSTQGSYGLEYFYSKENDFSEIEKINFESFPIQPISLFNRIFRFNQVIHV